MTVIQRLVIGKVMFDSENGKARMVFDRDSRFDCIDLTPEDVDQIAEFFNGVIRSYHVREYRLRGEPE